MAVPPRVRLPSPVNQRGGVASDWPAKNIPKGCEMAPGLPGPFSVRKEGWQTRPCASIAVQLNHGLVLGAGRLMGKDGFESVPMKKGRTNEKLLVIGSSPVLGAGSGFCTVSASLLPQSGR